MKTILSILFISLLLTGCYHQSEVPEYHTQVVTKTIYKTKIVKVPVYQPVHIPDVNCSFKGKNFQPTIELLKCLTLHKHILDQLRNEEHNYKK